MGYVLVTGNVSTHAGVPFPADRRPELWFRPNRNNIGEGTLLAGVERFGNLDITTGEFAARLSNDAGVTYTAYLRWLQNPDEPDPEMWAFQYAEWPQIIYPGGGGRIDDLITPVDTGGITFGLGPPPAGMRGVVYVDLADETEDGARIYYT